MSALQVPSSDGWRDVLAVRPMSDGTVRVMSADRVGWIVAECAAAFLAAAREASVPVLPAMSAAPLWLQESGL